MDVIRSSVLLDFIYSYFIPIMSGENYYYYKIELFITKLIL